MDRKEKHIQGYLTVAWHTFRYKWEQVSLLIFTLLVFIFGTETATWLRVVAVPYAFFLLYDIVDYFLKRVREWRVKHVPLFVAVGVNDDEYIRMGRMVRKAMSSWSFNLNRYETEYGVDRLWLSLHQESDLQQIGTRWVSLVEKFGERLVRLGHDLSGQIVLHTFLNCPTALAVGIGAVAGTRYEEVLHQLPQGGGDYVVVANTLLRRQEREEGVEIIRREVSEPFRCIRVETEPDIIRSRLFVALHFGGFSPCSSVAGLAGTHGASFACIANEYEGQLKPEDDWLLVAREVKTQIVRWVASPSVERIELFLGGPVALYFLVGMALGTFLPITVNQWFPDAKIYTAVLHLDQLRRVG